MSEENNGYQKLSKGRIEQKVVKLQGWKVVNDKLNRTFEFESFVQVFGFMTKVAMEAEKMNHHPEWFNIYNRLDLVTHDVDGISNYDIKLAEIINQVYDKENHWVIRNLRIIHLLSGWWKTQLLVELTALPVIVEFNLYFETLLAEMKSF